MPQYNVNKAFRWWVQLALLVEEFVVPQVALLKDLQQLFSSRFLQQTSHHLACRKEDCRMARKCAHLQPRYMGGIISTWRSISSSSTTSSANILMDALVEVVRSGSTSTQNHPTWISSFLPISETTLGFWCATNLRSFLESISKGLKTRSRLH